MPSRGASLIPRCSQIKCPGGFAVPSGSKCPQSNKEMGGRMRQMRCTGSLFLPAAGDKAIGVPSGWKGSSLPWQCPLAGDSPLCRPFPSSKHVGKHRLHPTGPNEVSGPRESNQSVLPSCTAALDTSRGAAAAPAQCSAPSPRRTPAVGAAIAQI